MMKNGKHRAMKMARHLFVDREKSSVQNTFGKLSGEPETWKEMLSRGYLQDLRDGRWVVEGQR